MRPRVDAPDDGAFDRLAGPLQADDADDRLGRAGDVVEGRADELRTLRVVAKERGFAALPGSCAGWEAAGPWAAPSRGGPSRRACRPPRRRRGIPAGRCGRARSPGPRTGRRRRWSRRSGPRARGARDPLARSGSPSRASLRTGARSETCFFIHRARGQHGVEVDPVVDLPDRSDPHDHPGDGPALRIQDTPADGHVVPDQPQRHLAPLDHVAGLDPGRCESRCGDRDLGLVPTGHAPPVRAIARTLVQLEMEPAVRIRRRHTPLLPRGHRVVARSSDVRHRDARRPRRRPPACRRGRAPGREPGMCRPCRRSPVWAAGRRSSAVGRAADTGCAIALFGASCPSETRAADAPQPIRPAASRAADADVSFRSNMILNTS